MFTMSSSNLNITDFSRVTVRLNQKIKVYFNNISQPFQDHLKSVMTLWTQATISRCVRTMFVTVVTEKSPEVNVNVTPLLLMREPVPLPGCF